MNNPKILTEQVVFNGQLSNDDFDIVEQQIKLPTGQTIKRHTIIKHDKVVVLLINDQQEVYLKPTYQSSLKQLTDDVITGVIYPYEDWEDAALRTVTDATDYHLLPLDINFIDSGSVDINLTNEYQVVFVGYIGNQTQFDNHNPDGKWVSLTTANNKIISMAVKMGLNWLKLNMTDLLNRYHKLS